MSNRKAEEQNRGARIERDERRANGLTLTPRQVVENSISADARNIDAVLRMSPSERARAFMIEGCARRLFEARAIDRDLERHAERNLRRALGL